jgi:hypothetical protein
MATENNVTTLPSKGKDEQSDAEAAAAVNSTPDRDLGEGHSIEDLANEVDEQAELFPVGSLEGDDMTPQKFIKKGLPVEVTVAIGQAEVPMSGGGLLDPERRGRVLVSYAFAKNIEIPTIEDGKLKGWKIRQMLRSTYVEQANDEAALIKKEFEALLALDASEAGAVLDDLGAMFRESASQTA